MKTISGWAIVWATVTTAATFGADILEPPLLLKGDNTVILDGAVYAGKYLQRYLIKCVARLPEADQYTLDAKPSADRFAAPAFPMIRGQDALDAFADKVVLAVGYTPYLTEEDRARIEEKAGTVLVQRRGKVIVIAGAKKGGPWLGEMAAVRVFLDKACGVRMYAPDGADGLEWVSMPKENAVTVKTLDLFMRPHFAKATFSTGGFKRNAEWLRMNAIVSEGLDLRASHTIINYFQPEKYYEKHPQLYPMGRNGERPKPIGGAWNPCLADADLAAQVAMDEIRRDEKARGRGYLSFGVMDCAYDCHCPVCRKSMNEHAGDAANLWYTFLNKVAAACRKEFPGLYLTSYHYSNIGIPTGMRMEPNIVIDNVIKSYRFADEGYWDAEKRSILRFAGLGAAWVTHDWNFQGVTPRIYSRQLAALLQWGAQNGMLGIYTEWSGQEYWYLAGAHYWVLHQLLSDPYQDPDMLWRQYCQDMYGDGWEEMYRFYDLFQQKYIVANKYHGLDDWPRREALAFLPEDLSLQRQWLEAAIAKTRNDTMIQRRLAAVMRYFRGHELLALAVGEPGRLHHRHTVLEKQTGINKEALAFYVNDDGSRLAEFDRYYDEERTLPPDSNIEDNASGIRFSYRNNYSRALGTIIAAVKAQAIAGADLERANRATVEQVIEKARAIYRANLPPKYDARRVLEIQALMEKFLWIPRVQNLPKFDGDLSDAVWAKASRLDGWTQADLLVPTREGNETEGRIMRVGDQLVIGLVCAQPNGIWAETPADIAAGTRIWRETGCEFFFGPPPKEGEKGEVFQYIVNALGAFRGFRQAQDNRKDVLCAVKVADDRKSYTIEAALPLKVEGQYDYTAPGAYTFNVMRNPFYANTFNSKERIGWAPIFFTAQVPESRGLVFLE